MLGIYMIINNFYGVLLISIYVFYLRELHACMYIYVCYFQKLCIVFLYCSKDVIFFKKKYTYVFDIQFFSASKQRNCGRKFKHIGTGEKKDMLDRN